ncbi:hypothetical protein [Peribacillus sp. TH24]|uniref:hypothetical protein n=1 Tax=Peribacillus sp. TH24 TaxID=2798483 RepID=UPI001913B3F9|nr:hypothetical protein [Peribacillus sp. TH24]MBK5444166.1 hypothetical protein [Peribacillus sp. TH24]
MTKTEIRKGQKVLEEKSNLLEETKHCGLIMPIASMPGGYTIEHWLEVKGIIIEAVESVEGHKFKTDIVSNSDGEIDVIHQRIIQNLYNADIVICDLSGRNPNVLFELGMRLTFDKPTILIKDDATEFMFDTGLIEHLQYPKDLRFSKVVAFKKELARRVKKTYERSISDSNFSTFLGNFDFKVPSLKQTELTEPNQLILNEISTLGREISNLKKDFKTNHHFSPTRLKEYIKDYIESHDAIFDSAEELLHKDEFISYLQSNGIDVFNFDRLYLKKIIASTQEQVLPF